MIRAIIFDCFGVFYVDPVISYVQDPKSPPELANALHDLDKQAAHGMISRGDFIRQAAELFGLSPEEADRRFFRGTVRNKPLLDFAERLRATYKIGMLSNIGADMMDGFFTKEDQATLFDVVVLSGEVGVAKPSREIYEYAASQLQLASAECVFVDDLEENCDGARAAGMQAIRYEDFWQIKQALDRLLADAKN
jgi:FMN phosphatase YigB (HAD superfamily)